MVGPCDLQTSNAARASYPSSRNINILNKLGGYKPLDILTRVCFIFTGYAVQCLAFDGAMMYLHAIGPGTMNKYSLDGSLANSRKLEDAGVDDGGVCFDSKINLFATCSGQYINRTAHDGRESGKGCQNIHVTKSRAITAIAHCPANNSYIITDGELNIAMIVSKEQKVKTIKKCALKCPVSVSCHQKLIAISDSSNHNVKIIRTSGYLKQILGSYGDGPFQLFRPFGVCMDQKGRVVVCDYGNKRVVRFTMGGYCGASNQWEILLTPEQLEYCHPCHVTIATSGLVAVSLQTETGIDKIALFTGYH